MTARSSSQTTAPETGRLSRDDWISGAIRFLAVSGVDALRLDALATELGVTKGSFYAHFKSRRELIDAVLDRWRHGVSREVLRIVRNKELGPLDTLRKLLELSFVDNPDVTGGPFEMTLRGWARRDNRVREIMHYVDNSRIAEVRSLYLEAGLDRKTADAYALLHMTFVTGGRMMLGDADAEERKRRHDIGAHYLIDAFDERSKSTRKTEG